MKRRSIFISVVLFLLAHGAFSVGTDGLSAFVMEGDSVALHTDVDTKQQEDIKWYFNDSRIAQISGDLSFICTDVQCNGGNERFRDRLKLDNKTGSLTIRDIRTRDSGLYELKIISIKKSSEKTFSVTVHDVLAAKQDEIKRKSAMERESVTLDPGVMKNPDDLMTWHFNDICIAEINEEPRLICTDAQCEDNERFRLDYQTGSLTIMNTRSTDSGLYTLQIRNSKISIVRSFSVIVTASGLSAGEIFAVVGGLLIMAGSVCVFYVYKCRLRKIDTRMQNSSQANGVNKSSDRSDTPLMDDGSTKADIFANI